MRHEIFRFADCELRVATRELLVRGEPRPLEPRPFDVLLHLARHRVRAVGVSALLDRLWPPGVGSDAAVARAVMKIRHALGDARALVRTVRRAGYRLAATLAPEGAPGHASSASIALLPFENDSGQPDLDWVELGLASLVVRELVAAPGLAVVTMPTLIAALQACPDAGTPGERALALRRLLGVRHVLRVRVLVDGRGHRLVAELQDDAAAAIELAGDEVVELARSLARALVARLLPDAPAAPGSSSEAAETARALGRALQALAQQRWTLALSLLEPVLERAPRHPVALRERLRALVALDDDRAFEVGRALLADEPALAGAVHLELAQAHVRRRMTRQARAHLDAALRAGAATREDGLAVTLLRAQVAMNEFDFEASARLLARAEADCAPHGNVFDRIRLTSLRIVHEAESGRMASARDHARRAADLCRDHGLMVAHARALSNLANASASLGRFGEAVQHAEAAFALSRSLGVPTDMAVAGVLLCGLLRQLRRPAAVAHALQSFASGDEADAPRSALFPLVGRVQLALARRQFAQAAPLLARAREVAAAGGQQLELHYVLPLLAGALAAAGRLIEAEQACAEMAALPRFAHDRNLQGARLHCQAQLAHAGGDAGAALALLEQAAALAPAGWWNALARIDGAWLHLEQGADQAAASLVAGLEAWCDEHPAGRLVRARLLHAQGREADARAVHALTTAAMEPAAAPFFDAVEEALAAARRSGAQAAFPVAPSLASWL